MAHALKSSIIEQHPLHAPKAVTLFSGIGGSSKALRDLGFMVIAHDFAPDAVASLKANGFIARECDVREVDWSLPQYANVEILEGGPPCQPFSQSHQGDGRYDPRDMIPEFIRAVAELSPKVFVMEEVQTLTWAKHKDYLDRVLDDMRALGYVVEARVVNAADYFIPQNRKRLIVVGVRQDVADSPMRRQVLGGPIAWPEKSTTKRTMAEALGWDEFEANRRNAEVPDPRAHVENVTWPYERPAPTVVGSFRPEVAAAPGYRKAGDPPRQATPGSVVTTFEERLLLQDFPADWKCVGNKASRDLQIGNSVPVGMMREIIDINIP